MLRLKPIYRSAIVRNFVYHKANLGNMTTVDDVHFESANNVGIITLNRESQLNSLNLSMTRKILPIAGRWEKEKGAIIIRGGKNFCAGGDIKSVWEGDTGYLLPLYALNMLNSISTSEVPYVALMTGFAMGGGLALAVLGRYRVATEDTVAAMPEVKMGYLPDAGGSYFLPRLKYRLGYYLALTGNSLKAKDVKRSGLATHYVPLNKLQALEKALKTCGNDKDIRCALNAFSEHDDHLPLAENIKDIEYCFAGETVEEILNRLTEVENDWSIKTIKAMKAACPGSLKIALKALQVGSTLSVWQCLQMDFRLVYWSLRNHDLREGVRAVLIEKDNRPQWNPKSLSQVTDEYVEGFFKCLPDGKDLHVLPPTSKQ